MSAFSVSVPDAHVTVGSRGVAAVLCLVTGGVSLLLTLYNLFHEASHMFHTPQWPIPLWEAGLIVPGWIMWMTIVLYFLARVTDVADKQLKKLTHHTERQELRDYANDLIEKGTICISVAKQRWSVGSFNVLMMTLMLTIVFTWSQNKFF